MSITAEDAELLPIADALEHSQVLFRRSSEGHHWKPVQGSVAECEIYEGIRLGLTTDVMIDLLRAIGCYSGAALQHTLGVASLLRLETLHSVPLSVRSSLEHAQRALWLLEPTHQGTGVEEDRVTARQRAARGQLEWLYSERHYRDTLELLTMDTKLRKPAREAYKRRKQQIIALYPEAELDGEPDNWIVEDQQVPPLTKLSSWYFRTMAIGETGAVGIYAALSGSAHPNLCNIAEDQIAIPTDDGGMSVEWDYGHAFIVKACVNLASTLYCMLKQIYGYFGWEDGVLHAWADWLNKVMPTVVVDNGTSYVS